MAGLVLIALIVILLFYIVLSKNSKKAALKITIVAIAYLSIVSCNNEVKDDSKSNQTIKEYSKISKNVKTENKTKKEKEIINGYTLPPEPDPKVNNSTLLGIDSNNNGVRDDVERWIYKKYKDKHPIYIAIMMQAARASKKILTDPEAEGRAQENETSKVLDCSSYYRTDATYFGDKNLITEPIDFPYFWHAIYFNTKERKEKLEQMSLAASGGVFDSLDGKEAKSVCSEEVLKVAK